MICGKADDADQECEAKCREKVDRCHTVSGIELINATNSMNKPNPIAFSIESVNSDLLSKPRFFLGLRMLLLGNLFNDWALR